MSVPVITPNGDQHVHVEVLTGTYTELGAISSGGETVIIGGDTVNKDITDLYTITYDSTSSYGERAQTVYRTVEVIDTVPPIITMLGDSTAIIEGGSIYVDAGATAHDNYDGDVSVNVFNPVNTMLVSTYYVEYNARDSAGNLATSTRTVLVVDTTPPEASLVGSETVYLDAQEIFNDSGITATDIIDGIIPPERKFVTDRVVPHTLGTYTNDYWAEDIAENASAILHRTIHIEDYTPPVITLRGSSNIVKQAKSTPFTDPGATAVDYCDGTVSVTRTGHVSVTAVGDYPLWYSAHDAAGNEAVPILRTVHVIDLVRPVLTLRGRATVTFEAGTPYADAGCTAKDNYDSVLVINARIVVDNPVNYWVPGDYIVTFNVTDTNGNVAVPSLHRHVHVVITQGMYIQVVDEDTNEPLENIEVEYHEYDPINKYVGNDILFRATTDSSGMAHINIASAPEIGAFVMFGPLITDVDGFQYRQYNTRRIVWEGQDPFVVKFPKSETFLWKSWDENGNLVRGDHPNYRYYMIHIKGKYYPTGPECYIFFGYATNLDYDTIGQDFYFMFDDYAREQPDFNPIWPYYDNPAPPAYGLPAFSITQSTEVAMHILYYNVPNYGVVHLVADNGGDGYSCSRSGQLHIINGNFELLRSVMMAAQRFAQVAGGDYYQRMVALYARYQVISNITSDPEKAVQSLSLLAEVLELREEGELLLAENNISIYRKGQVNVTVRSSNKAPMSGISLKITQLSHSFNFGINPEITYNQEISTGLDQAIADGFNSAFVSATLYQTNNYEDLGIVEIKEKGFRVFAVRTIENTDTTIPYLDQDLLYIWENNRSAFPEAYVARRAALFQYINLLNGMDVISNPTIDYSSRFPMSIEEVIKVTQESTYDAGINHEMIQNKKNLMIDSEFEGDYGKKFVLYRQTLDSSRTELPVDSAREGLITYIKRISNLPEFSQIDSIGLRAYPGFNTGYFNSWWVCGYCPSPIFYADLFRRLGSFNKLVHITAITIPSSTLAGDPLNGWYKAPWDEYSQIEYVDKFYRLAFGSPKVASICWKDLYDIESKNQGNGGLLTEGGDKKEVYYHIIDLIKNNWWSYEEGVTGGLNKQFVAKIFGGRYKAEITLPNNQVIIHYFDMEPRNVLNLIIDTDYSAPIIPWKIPITLPTRNTGYIKKFIEERGVG